MGFPPDFPIVCKIGHAQSGFGKMRIFSDPDFQDFRSVCGLMNDYVTAESFIDWDWDGRVQKIGRHYRAFKRTSNHWKGNVGGFQAKLEEIPITQEMKRWVDECSLAFGGLDILGLDFVHSKEDGKFYILELNDTAIGLFHDVEEEDLQHLRELVVVRMSASETVVESNEEQCVESELKNAYDEIAALRLQLQEAESKVEALEKSLAESKAEEMKPKRWWGLFGN